jgi:hypothetical protein
MVPKPATIYGVNVGLDDPIFVNYDQSLSQLLRNDSFAPLPYGAAEPLPPPRGRAQIVPRLFKFEEFRIIDPSEEEMRKNGHIPADAWMLVAFARRFPDFQCSNPVLASGTVLKVDDMLGPLIPCIRTTNFFDPPVLGRPKKKIRKYRTFEWLPRQWGFEPRYYYLCYEEG